MVDAIDECGSGLRAFLEKLEFVQRQSSVGIIMTDKFEDRDEWRRHFHKKKVHRLFSDPEDINWYLSERMKLEEIPVIKSNGLLRQRVFQTVVEASRGV